MRTVGVRRPLAPPPAAIPQLPRTLNAQPLPPLASSSARTMLTLPALAACSSAGPWCPCSSTASRLAPTPSSGLSTALLPSCAARISSCPAASHLRGSQAGAAERERGGSGGQLGQLLLRSHGGLHLAVVTARLLWRSTAASRTSSAKGYWIQRITSSVNAVPCLCTPAAPGATSHPWLTPPPGTRTHHAPCTTQHTLQPGVCSTRRPLPTPLRTDKSRRCSLQAPAPARQRSAAPRRRR